MNGVVREKLFFSLKNKTQKKLILIGLSVFLLGGMGVFAYEKWASPQKSSTFTQAVSVKRGDVTESISASGTVQASKRITLSPSESGKPITSINVRIGDHVKAGQILATLDDSDAKIQLKSAEANLLSAKAHLAEAEKTKTAEEMKALQANLNQAKAALDMAKNGYDTQKARYDLEKAKTSLQNAQRTYQSQNTLYQAGAISKSEFDQAKLSLEQAQNEYNAAVLQHNQAQGQSTSDLEKAQSAYETAVAQLNEAKEGPDASTLQSARASVEEAEAQLLQKQKALADLTIKAPMDGVIIEINGNVGEIPENPFIVMDNSNSVSLEVLAQISESDIGKVKEGLTATFTSESYSDKKFTGKVSLVYPEATTDSGVTSYKVLLSVDNKDGLLKTGMSMNVNIEVGTHKNVLYVPAAALINKNGKDGVYLASHSQSGGSSALPYHFQSVTIGYYSSDMVEITSGLQEGDQIILTFNNSTSATSNNKQNRMNGFPGFGGMGVPPGGGIGGGPRGN